MELYDDDNELVQPYSLGDTNGVASRTFYASDVKCSDGGCDNLGAGDASDVPMGSWYVQGLCSLLLETSNTSRSP